MRDQITGPEQELRLDYGIARVDVEPICDTKECRVPGVRVLLEDGQLPYVDRSYAVALNFKLFD
jgi:hypothetical protein